MTSWNPVDRLVRAWEEIPDGSLGRRVLLAFTFALGLTLTAMGSMFWGFTAPIPWKIIPDLRIFVLMTSGMTMGLVAAGGGVSRRRPALWLALGMIIGFHLEEASVHWIGPFPGSITGTRVGILGTAGSLLALLSLLLLHVEVESARLRSDLTRRGAAPDAAERLRAGVQALGRRRLVGIAVGIAAFAVLVRAGEALFGNTARGGAWVLLAGAALLGALAWFLLRLAKPKATAAPASAEAGQQEA